MFIFKYVTPYVFNFYNINANHLITLFIISKKAYHDMKAFNTSLKERDNFLKLSPYFNEFANNPKYKELVELTTSDLEIIYKEDIESCSNDVKREFELEKIYHSNWGAFVKETISSYEFQLGEAIDKVKGDKKKDLIMVIEALAYLQEHAENADIEEFDKRIESTDFMKVESKIKERMAKIFEWN
jgi:hypothetical protein